MQSFCKIVLICLVTKSELVHFKFFNDQSLMLVSDSQTTKERLSRLKDALFWEAYDHFKNKKM